MQIPIVIEFGDALAIKSDVLVLKYAQAHYGVDWQVTAKLKKFHDNLRQDLPKIGQFLKVQTYGCLGSNEVLYVGVEPLEKFSYANIRDFARRALEYLGRADANVQHICFTLHGAGYGLDERESFEAEIAGFVDALSERNFPAKLEKITIVEYREERAQRLKKYLDALLPDGVIRITERGTLQGMAKVVSNRLRTVGYTSNSKPLAFVAMPFDEKMYDVFYYGIKGAVNMAGYLCERIDEAYFTGDIMEQVRKKIQAASLVIVDLTFSNPNVYLELGYAWGLGKKTILLTQDINELKFDVRGQRCLEYNGIRELENLLGTELKHLELDV